MKISTGLIAGAGFFMIFTIALFEIFREVYGSAVPVYVIYLVLFIGLFSVFLLENLPSSESYESSSSKPKVEDVHRTSDEKEIEDIYNRES